MTRIDVHAIRREQILDAVALLMEEHGWAGVTFAAICRAADISNGVLTYHFKDKDDLLFAFYERTVRQWHREVWSHRVDRNEPFPQRIAAAVREMLQRADEKREFRLLSFHFLSLATERPDIAARMKELQFEQITAITEELRAEVARGTVHRDPEEAAAMVLSVVMGFGFMRKAIGIAVSEDALAEMLMTYLADPAPRIPAPHGHVGDAVPGQMK